MSAMRVPCPDRIDQETGRDLLALIRKSSPSPGTELTLDLSGTNDLDTLGSAWLVEIGKYLNARSCTIRWEGHQGRVADFMSLIEPVLLAPPLKPKPKDGILARLGEAGLNVYEETREFLDLMFDAVYWTILAPFEGRGFRWGLWTDEVHEMGVRAIRIVCLMNFLLGLIIAMLSAAQVEPFGMGIYVANLIIISFMRELGPVMTAVVVAARTGAAIAAELATMKVQEEIDALRGMGLNVSQFLVAPKVLALVIVLPLLTTLGMMCGVLGGATWGILVMGFRPDIWYSQTLGAATFSDFFQGSLKALVFAIMIVLVGCHNGLRVRGGSRGVGLMTTRAVVMDIFGMICIDIIFAAIFYYVLDRA